MCGLRIYAPRCAVAVRPSLWSAIPAQLAKPKQHVWGNQKPRRCLQKLAAAQSRPTKSVCPQRNCAPAVGGKEDIMRPKALCRAAAWRRACMPQSREERLAAASVHSGLLKASMQRPPVYRAWPPLLRAPLQQVLYLAHVLLAAARGLTLMEATAVSTLRSAVAWVPAVGCW